MASSCSQSKRPPAGAALLMGEQAGQPFLLVGRQPLVHRVGAPPVPQPVASDPVGGFALGDLQQRGTPLPHVGARVVVPMSLQRAPLLPTQRSRSLRSHLTHLLLCLGVWLHLFSGAEAPACRQGVSAVSSLEWYPGGVLRHAACEQSARCDSPWKT